jgi:signal transduction histidine kinase
VALGADLDPRHQRGRVVLIAALVAIGVTPLVVVIDSVVIRLALVALVWLPLVYVLAVAPRPEQEVIVERLVEPSDAEEAKSLFLAAASHELKTPLTVIRGFSQMLALPDNQMTDDERSTALRAIDVRARQLTTIVDRILLSSRIESGRIDLTPEIVDVVPMLEQLVRTAENSTSRVITLDIEHDLPELWVDPQAFSTVVDHLLDNAIKYSPGGGPIVLSMRAAGDLVELVCVDEGVGMTPEHVARCFDRFWQAELSDARQFGGTGIGLYIVRSLVEAMNGHVSVTSSPGEGSTFRVVLTTARALDQGQSAWELKELRQ